MNNNPSLSGLLFFLGLTLATSLPVRAYDNETVHPAINEKAGRQSKINDYVKTNLGYAEGIEKQISGKEVWWWLREGGKAEDFLARPLLHFHDPLQPWSSAGLWGSTSASGDWAQRSDNGASWQKARDHFYQALTIGSEAELATTFKTLGQLMHLVSDLAVPAHVRNDAHPNGDLYEAWAAEKKNDDPQHYIGSTVDPAIFSQAITASETPSPITALWDLDEYNGTNPSITIPGILPPMPGFLPIPVSGPMKIGLAEYTNANFFSKDTIFKNYDNPSYWNTTPIGDDDWLNPETVPGEDGKPDKRVYVWGYAGGNGNIRLAGASLITRDSANAGYVSPPMVIDDNVSKDYASRLVPAAVGYSTALLDYFFRGDIDLKPESAGGYSLVNNTLENMTGTFAVYYNDTSGTRRKLVEWASSTVPANGRTQVGSIAIPADHAVPPKYFLVFNGKMGGEDGAVAGRVVSLKPSKEYLLVIMSTSFPYSPTTKVETPDIVTLWDMETNSYAQITDTNGDQVSFPITYQELNSKTSNLSDYQVANSEQLLSVGYFSGGKIPDCPLTYQGDSNCTKYNYHNCSYMCSTPNYTGSGNCTTSSPSLGDFNTISISKSGNYKFETFGCGDTYETDSQEYTSGENIFVNSTSNNTTLLLPWFSNTPLFPISHAISIVNNDSGAAIKYLNNTLTLKNTEIYRHESAREYGETCNEASWFKTTREVSINATVTSDFFKWTSTMPSRYTQISIGNDNQWDYNQCSDMTYWSPLPETHSHFDIALTSLAYDVSGTGLQSTSNNQNQFQIGIVHSSLREISVGLARDLSGDTYNPATYGPIKTYTKVFYSKWPKEISDTGSQARNVNPWSHPWNDSLEGAVEGMTRYFAQNYGEEPAQLRPDYFDKFIFEGWKNPLTIAQQNLWKRKFDIKYLTSK